MDNPIAARLGRWNYRDDGSPERGLVLGLGMVQDICAVGVAGYIGGKSALQTPKPSLAAQAALNIEAAKLLMRDVLVDVMEQRNRATIEMRSTWLSRLAHAVYLSRSAVQDIASVTGASGERLDNPIQRALRDITTGSNHIIFDREIRYADYGRILLDQPVHSLMI